MEELKIKTAPEIDLATTLPGTPGGRFMRQFWTAIYRSQDVHASARRIARKDVYGSSDHHG